MGKNDELRDRLTERLRHANADDETLQIVQEVFEGSENADVAAWSDADELAERLNAKIQLEWTSSVLFPQVGEITFVRVPSASAFLGLYKVTVSKKNNTFHLLSENLVNDSRKTKSFNEWSKLTKGVRSQLEDLRMEVVDLEHGVEVTKATIDKALHSDTET